MLPPSSGMKRIHSTLMTYKVRSFQHHYQPTTLQCQNQFTTSKQTPPRKPAKLCSQVFSILCGFIFNQSQCLDFSNIFLDPYLSISAKSQCFHKYNYWLNQQKYIQNMISFQVCFRISYLLKPCLIKYYSNSLLITVWRTNISSVLKKFGAACRNSFNNFSHKMCVCVCVYSLHKNMRTFHVTVYLSCTLVSEAEWMEQWLWANSGTDFLDTLNLIKTLQFVLTKIWQLY
jgi:hypothetical protein